MTAMVKFPNRMQTVLVKDVTSEHNREVSSTNTKSYKFEVKTAFVQGNFQWYKAAHYFFASIYSGGKSLLIWGRKKNLSDFTSSLLSAHAILNVLPVLWKKHVSW